MFEEFDKPRSAEGRGRMGVSVLISGAICFGIAVALAAAVATARVVVKRRQNDIAVKFADIPRAPPPKKTAGPKARNPARKVAVQRPTFAPKGIPTDRPEEAVDGELVEAGTIGPVDAVLRAQPGDGGGKGEEAPAPTPPPMVSVTPAPEPESGQERESIVRPRFVSGCRVPEVPEGLHTLAATVQIEVRMVISDDGKVLTATVLKSNPLIPDEVVLRCAREQLFAPAHLPDGTAVAYPFHRRFVFRPA